MSKYLVLILAAAFICLLFAVAFLLGGSNERSDLIPDGIKRTKGGLVDDTWRGTVFNLKLAPQYTDISSAYLGNEESVSFKSKKVSVFVRAFPVGRSETLNSLFPPAFRGKIKRVSIENTEGLLLQDKKRSTFSFLRQGVFFEIVVLRSDGQRVINDILPRIQAAS